MEDPLRDTGGQRKAQKAKKMTKKAVAREREIKMLDRR